MLIASPRRTHFVRIRHAHLRAVMLLVTLTLLTSQNPLQAATSANLVKDINQTGQRVNNVSLDNHVTAVGNQVFFLGSDRGNGGELWVTQGTDETTHLVRDITPGPESTYIHELASVNQRLFFSTGRGLWKSDGTEQGTVQITELYGATQLRSLRTMLYFFASAKEGGFGLWRSDGTAAGTVQVTSIMRNLPTKVIAAHDRLFFIVDDGVHGHELWTSDGTADGTRMVNDLTASGSSFDSCCTPELVMVGSHVYFVTTAVYPKQLWKSDGTADGTVAVDADVRFVEHLTEVNGTLFFRGIQQIDPMGTISTGLWRSNGHADDTYEIKSFFTGSNVTYSPTNFVSVGGKLLFHGGYNQVWISGGSEASTVQLGITSEDPYRLGAYASALNGQIFFLGGPRDNAELWATDGTANGTYTVKDINPNGSSLPVNFMTVNGKLFFTLFGNSPYRGLWTSDGTTDGTRPVRRPSPITDAISREYTTPTLLSIKDRLFFQADDGIHGNELWTSDGTRDGTYLVKDIHPTGNGGPRGLTMYNDTLYFVAATESSSGLWTSDGTAYGTTPVMTFASPMYSVRNLHVVAGRLLFFVHSSTAAAIWSSDGTAAGTTKIVDVPESANPMRATVVNNRLFFTAVTTQGREVWTSDGTAAGTLLLKDINPGSYSADPFGFTDVQGTLFFFARGVSGRHELWKSDGRPDGTVLVASINYWDNPEPEQLTAVGDRLFFTAYDQTAGVELWTSNGTAAGTQRVKDIHTGYNNDYWLDPANGSSRPQSLAAAGGMLLFTADDGVHGRELWRSDGTEAGTTIVTDLNPGSISSTPSGIQHIGNDGKAVFAASNGWGGVEVWETRGTATSTVRIADIATGASSSNPIAFTPAGSTLFFVADDGIIGDELWAISHVDVAPVNRHAVYLPVVRHQGR